MDKLTTIRGPLFKWGTGKPVVVYVHGYYDTAESAIRKHNLVDQLSVVDATFLVPEAPTAGGKPVNFPNLAELLLLAGRDDATDVVVIGHSGAHKTIRNWLDEPRLKHLVLLDAAYSSIERFADWGSHPGHKLDVVGAGTAENSKRIAAGAGVPYHQGKSHMGIVTEEGWIARFLRESPFLQSRLSLPMLLAIGAGGYLLYRAFSRS